jgi:uncharacterized protein YbcV (DUF1398 family)
MNEQQIATARQCLGGAEGNTMAFPEIVGTLIAAGFESYTIDFRRATATYYLADGDSIALPTHRIRSPIAAGLDAAAMTAAIREAQNEVPGYTYDGFCEKAALAGCAGYVVSFTGRRALYIGRTAEVHVEHFPS